MIEPPRPFKGKEGVRQLLEWDVRLSPVAKSRPLGIGLLVKDNVAVEEEVLEQTYKGRPYEYSLVRVFEIGGDGKIRRLRADEVLFMRESIDRYHEAARASGVLIVHACGVDSIPSDLGVPPIPHRAPKSCAGHLDHGGAGVQWSATRLEPSRCASLPSTIPETARS